MKLKQTLVIGLTSAILAIPATAEVSPADATNAGAAAVKPAHAKKGHKKTALAALETKDDNAKKADDKSSTANPSEDQSNTVNDDQKN